MSAKAPNCVPSPHAYARVCVVYEYAARATSCMCMRDGSPLKEQRTRGIGQHSGGEKTHPRAATCKQQRKKSGTSAAWNNRRVACNHGTIHVAMGHRGEKLTETKTTRERYSGRNPKTSKAGARAQKQWNAKHHTHEKQPETVINSQDSLLYYVPQ